MTYEFKEPIPTPSAGWSADPVGVLEIADRLGVKDRSVHKMIQRGVMPPPDYVTVNGSRAWEWRTILWWAGETQRLAKEALREEYRFTFRRDAPIARRRVPSRTTVRPDPTPDLPSVPSL
jgi:hypothetical protein